MRRAFVGLAIVLSWGLPASSAATIVHMAPNGRDTGDGSAVRPFATLARAQSAVRELKQTSPGALTVELAPGTYHLAAPLLLSAEDSGRPDAPITYTAAPGADVRLTGSVALQLTWKPWRDGPSRMGSGCCALQRRESRRRSNWPWTLAVQPHDAPLQRLPRTQRATA